MPTTLTFLGTSAVLPGPGEDGTCFLVNGRVLFDAGWCAPLGMLQFGCDPLAVEYLFFTHCHQDHYLGLPALIFYRGMMSRQRGQGPPLLRVIGPPDDMPLVVERARAFLQVERFSAAGAPVELHPLPPGQPFETGAFRIETAPSRHGVQGSVGRLLDKETGVVIAFSGDTGINPDLPRLARGADLLVHEASLPPEAGDEEADTHSRAADAARVAAQAGVASLRLVHLHGDHAERSLAAARAIFPATELAVRGETLRLGR